MASTSSSKPKEQKNAQISDEKTLSCSLLGLFTCSSGLLPKKETNKNGKLLRNEKSNTQLQYDSASYALNFDDGAQKDDANYPFRRSIRKTTGK